MAASISEINGRILVVEDNAGINLLVTKKLSRNGYETTSVSSAKEAIEKLEKYQYDLILLDYFLPDARAKDLVESHLSDEFSTPFIILTGNGDERTAVQMMKLGAKDYLIKDELFVDTIAHVVNRTLKQIFAEKDLITAQKQLKESRERLDLAFNTAKMGFLDVLLDTKEVIYNAFWQDITGKPAERKYLLADLEALVFPEDRQTLRMAWMAFLNGQTEHFLANYRILDKEGKTHWIFDQGRIVEKNSDGTPKRAIRTQLDKTATHDHEEQRQALEKQLRHSQKLETIGTLAGGIAHDFNNILAAIFGVSELALRRKDNSEATQKDLNNIIQSVKRARNLVKQILIFSRQEELDRRRIDVSLIIEESIEFLRPSFPVSVSILPSIQKNAGLILADATQIHQIIINLATNAYQALENSQGTIEIGLQRINFTSDASFPNVIPGEYLRLRIDDTGKGIEEGSLERIFEPFYTTKSVGEGTGLGLSVVHGIVKQHDGHIAVKSEVGKGTTFTILFPIVHEAPEKRDEENPTLLRGHGKILIVDDESSIVDFGNEALSCLGYSVISFNDPTKALEHFMQADDLDLIITDYSMPDFTGLEFARRIRKKYPNMPIILMTGYLDTFKFDPRNEGIVDCILQKPFGIAELSRAIAHELKDRKKFS